MSRTWRMAKIATLATLAVVLLSGGVASATTLRASGGFSTGTGHHGRHHHHAAPTGVFGTVASVDGTSTAGTCGVAAAAGTFTLNGAHATTFTVDVSTTTTFSEHGVTAPTFANVCVGEKAGALGLISSGTVTATSVFVVAPPTPKPHAVFGTLASVNGTSTTGTCGVAAAAGTFTLNGAHATTFTVDVSTTTTFSEHGVTAPTFANVCVGEKAGALGLISSGTVTATSVFVVAPPTPSTFKPHSVFGSPRGSGPGGSPDVSKPTGHTTNNHGRLGSGAPTNGPQRFGHGSGHHSH